jgi:hypothetical protein
LFAISIVNLPIAPRIGKPSNGVVSLGITTISTL